MKALILAAGYGTRLYPHTRNFPKALLKIGNRPIINYLVDKLKDLNGLSHTVVVTNNRFLKQFQGWSKKQDLNSRLWLFNDLTTSPQDKLGAIGDMNFVFAKDNFSADFLVLGGDNFFKNDLTDFMRFAKSKRPFTTIGLFRIKNRKEARHYGVVRLNRNNRVVELKEKPPRPNSNLVAMCLYYFPREKLRLIKQYLQNPLNCADTAGSYINWLSRKDKVYGFIFEDFWFDIGHIHTYKAVEKIITNKEKI
ncbi:nucleotidyltransferase family protein [Candidatus Omnitrophota bacterium]